MKKILLGFAAMAALTLASCADKASTAADGQSAAFTDSLSTSMGTMRGYTLLADYQRLPEDQMKLYDKKELLRGIKAMVMADTTQMGYVTGLGIGQQLWGQIAQMEKNGVAVDRKAVYEAFAKAFMADSTPDMAILAADNQRLMRQAQDIMAAEMQRKEDAAREAKLNSPEVKKNIEEGKAYMAALDKDPEVKTLPSGVKYKVLKAGSGDKMTANDRATVNYVGTLPDGTQFDANDGAKFSPRGVVPGFGEGLQQMQKGGSYMLYIPAELGYGLDGTPDGSIGPMQPLTFKVDVQDIERGPAAPQGAPVVRR